MERYEEILFQRRYRDGNQHILNITNHQGNANQNQLTSVDMAVKKEKRHVGKDVEKREHLCTVSGNVDWYSHYEKRYGDSSKNLK